MDDHRSDDEAIPGAMLARFDGMIVENAPNALVDSIVSSFVQAHRVESPIACVARRVRAVLAVDVGLTGPALAFRSGAAAASGPLHVVYRAGGADDTLASEIALSVYGGADNDVLIGQVFGADDADEADRSMVVEVLRSTRLVAAAPIGVAGEFSVGVPVGWTELVVVSSEAEITVPAPTDARPEPA